MFLTFLPSLASPAAVVFLGPAIRPTPTPQQSPHPHHTTSLNSYKKPLLVVGYHEVGGNPEFSHGQRYDVHGLNISCVTFRAQLEQMERARWYPVEVRDLVDPKFRMPSDRKPVVLTFDDGRATQFRYLRNGRLDPNCAVAILLAFHRSHPDWPLRATFYLIAGSDQNGVPFDQEGFERKKIAQLAQWGFEVANHSSTHPSFQRLSRLAIIRQISGCQRYLREIARIHSVSFALPYGVPPTGPARLAALVSGGSGPGAYLNTTIAYFNGSPQWPPGSPRFDPKKISRVAPAPGVVEAYIRASRR